MDFMELIKVELCVLVAALYGLGLMLKQTKKIKDKYIPLILGGAGIVLSCLYVFSTEGFTGLSTFNGIVQGVICAAAAVYTNQLIKQSSKSQA
jgi:hypothetical protein